MIDVTTNTETDTIGVGTSPTAVAFANCPVTGGGYVEPAVPVCSEHERVQSDPALASAGVGTEFRDNGVLYQIATGAGCSFNCVDGFDINCDGKLGDVCPAELNLNRVADVATCLARFAPTEPEPAPVSPAAVEAGDDTEAALAFTGTDTTLATAALALIGAGATLCGITRRHHHHHH